MRTLSVTTVIGLFVFSVGVPQSPVSAQPPAPAGEYVDYTPDSNSVSGWVDEPARVVMPRWKAMPWNSHGPQAGTTAPYFRDTELGEHPHYGHNGSPAAGYPHHDNRSAMSGIWYRPNGYLGTTTWNAPYSFNPMGNGAPQHRSAYRMDYAPATIVPTATQYGPYYYPRYRDLHAPVSEDCEDDPKYCRKKSFWLFGRK